jgi:hypothetical protein
MNGDMNGHMNGRLAGALLAWALVAVLLSGGLAHTLVPHAHGSNGIAFALWEDLHAALAHESKAALLMPALVIPLALGLLLFDNSLLFPATARTGVLRETRMLMRACYAYRRFG